MDLPVKMSWGHFFKKSYFSPVKMVKKCRGRDLNYEFWQADSLVGLIIAFFLIKEGYSTYKEEELCQC